MPDRSDTDPPGTDPASSARTADLPWAPVPKARAHELVIEAIEEQVMAGRLKVGDTLPPERELAAMLRVSRAGVREAIRVLESHGALESRVGAGASSGTVITAMPGTALTRLLRLHVGLSNFPLGDVVELRIALERASAGLAAHNADDGDLDRMRETLSRMESAEADREVFNDADTDFHVAIAEAAGNRLVADLTTAIRNSLRAQILHAFHRRESWEDLRGRLLDQHREIFTAVEAGDADRAAALIEQHIRFAVSELPHMGRPESGPE
ncbi:MAG: FadR/GntR family transcriptional regulator [Nesterenkonia sp.]|nr:FadR/GntR family transcriptional regulator [Nesterenkonia sp.]